MYSIERTTQHNQEIKIEKNNASVTSSLDGHKRDSAGPSNIPFPVCSARLMRDKHLRRTTGARIGPVGRGGDADALHNPTWSEGVSHATEKARAD